MGARVVGIGLWDAGLLQRTREQAVVMGQHTLCIGLLGGETTWAPFELYVL